MAKPHKGSNGIAALICYARETISKRGVVILELFQLPDALIQI